MTADILVFSKDESQSWLLLHQQIEQLSLVDRLSVSRSFEDLEQQLVRRDSGCPLIFIFLAACQEELDRVASMYSTRLFRDVKVIVILPDHERAAIDAALKLEPRFLTYADYDFVEVGGVLAKMIDVAPPAFFSSNIA